MGNEYIYEPLRQSVLQNDQKMISFYLDGLVEKTRQMGIDPILKAEIELEIVKALRAINESEVAKILCKRSIANAPANSPELLSAFGRLQALLMLDEGDIEKARIIIEGVDALELILDKGESLKTRKNEDVGVETWLVSCEISLAANDPDLAEIELGNAVEVLSKMEGKLNNNRRISPKDKKQMKVNIEKIEQLIKLFAYTIGIFKNSQGALQSVTDLYDEIARDNLDLKQSGGLPNYTIENRLGCLLGEITIEEAVFIPLAEAKRWRMFAEPKSISQIKSIEKNIGQNNSSLVVGSVESSLTSVPENKLNNVNKGVYSEQVVEMVLSKLGEFTEKIVKSVESIKLSSEPEKKDFEKRSFGGHVQDQDICTLFTISKNNNLTGYIDFEWHEDHFKELVREGILPEIVIFARARLYMIDGVIIDCTFGNEWEINDSEKASRKMIILTQICLSIGLNVFPHIISSTHRDEDVRSRKRLLNITDEMQIVDIIAGLEAATQGITNDDIDSENNIVEETDESSFENIFQSNNKPAAHEAEELSISTNVNLRSDDDVSAEITTPVEITEKVGKNIISEKIQHQADEFVSKFLLGENEYGEMQTEDKKNGKPNKSTYQNKRNNLSEGNLKNADDNTINHNKDDFETDNILEI